MRKSCLNGFHASWRKLQAEPELRDVASDQQNGGLQARLVIDRDTASRLGITPQMIDDTLYDAFGQRQISIMFTQLNQYRVVLEVKPELPGRVPRRSEATSTYARLSNGEVPLSAFTHFEQGTTPLAVNHQGQFPVVTISFNLAPTKSLGDAVTAVDRCKSSWTCRPASRQGFQGTALAFQASLTNTPILILAAVVTVYIVLGVLYESYIHPITILSTLPSAAVGALLALMLTGQDFSVIALIGIILLIGIVEKNAIMMIDFALDAERKEGKEPQDAIYQASLLRFRPIIMTTLAALLGGVPLALGTGTGAGTAPAARYRDRGRPDLQPASDAVHHARDLSGVRSDGAAFPAPRGAGMKLFVAPWATSPENLCSLRRFVSLLATICGADPLVRGRRPRRPGVALINARRAGPGGPARTRGSAPLF